MRIHRSRLALALAVAIGLSFGGTPAHAQDSAAVAPQAAAPAPTSAATTASSPASSGLPTEPAPPRTLRAYKHVWIAFTLAWVLLFGYVVSVGRRFSKVEREVESLGG